MVDCLSKSFWFAKCLRGYFLRDNLFLFQYIREENTERGIYPMHLHPMGGGALRQSKEDQHEDRRSVNGTVEEYLETIYNMAASKRL